MTPAQHSQRDIDYHKECPARKKGMTQCIKPMLDCRECIDGTPGLPAPAGCIITIEELNELDLVEPLTNDGPPIKKILKAIRSRSPHPPAPEQQPFAGGQMTDRQTRSDLIWMTGKQRDDLITEAARTAALAENKRVLDDLLYSIDGETGFYCFPHPKATLDNGVSRFILMEDLCALVASLRARDDIK